MARSADGGSPASARQAWIKAMISLEVAALPQPMPATSFCRFGTALAGFRLSPIVIFASLQLWTWSPIWVDRTGLCFSSLLGNAALIRF